MAIKYTSHIACINTTKLKPRTVSVIYSRPASLQRRAAVSSTLITLLELTLNEAFSTIKLANGHSMRDLRVGDDDESESAFIPRSTFDCDLFEISKTPTSLWRIRFWQFEH